jgi:hypothetical protein
MTYEKPEVIGLGTASDVIQNTSKGQGNPDTSEHKPSPGAYEADE